MIQVSPTYTTNLHMYLGRVVNKGSVIAPDEQLQVECNPGNTGESPITR